ncbi:MAG: amino acid adenylation domain-containing protein [Bacteroidota bacterium]|nr:amino acid adenylation domain-containing protein [Bacteroidota bacterium]
MFSAQVIEPVLNCLENSPDLPAFYINETHYTYHEFARRISAIRLAILKRKITQRNVGLITGDDLNTYASIFALWLEGFAYVPIHPTYPAERIKDILFQADIELVLSSLNPGAIGQAGILETTPLEFTELCLENKKFPESDFAYILFTSGSTGKPKGVPVTRSSLGHFMKAFWEIGFSITSQDRCLQGYDLTFDLSIQSFLVPLTRGACTYTIPQDQIKYSYLYGLLSDHQLTVLPIPPSMIRLLRPYFDEIEFDCVRYNWLGAEASDIELIAEWSTRIPKAEIYNCYGPTEATIYCTYSKFNRDGISKSANGLMSIGIPMNGITAIIIDENLHILDRGAKGELCIAGEQVTPGYLNQPQKNKESFVEIPYQQKMMRFYRTGDVCQFDSEGDILYYGRKDYQVKIQGFRIELGEIEFHAKAFLEGPQAVALDIHDKILGAYIVLIVEGKEQPTSTLTLYLKAKLPPYMIPMSVTFLSQFPLNANGKVDRIALRQLIQI